MNEYEPSTNIDPDKVVADLVKLHDLWNAAGSRAKAHADKDVARGYYRCAQIARSAMRLIKSQRGQLDDYRESTDPTDPLLLVCCRACGHTHEWWERGAGPRQFCCPRCRGERWAETHG